MSSVCVSCGGSGIASNGRPCVPCLARISESVEQASDQPGQPDQPKQPDQPEQTLKKTRATRGSKKAAKTATAEPQTAEPQTAKPLSLPALPAQPVPPALSVTPEVNPLAAIESQNPLAIIEAKNSAPKDSSSPVYLECLDSNGEWVPWAISNLHNLEKLQIPHRFVYRASKLMGCPRELYYWRIGERPLPAYTSEAAKEGDLHEAEVIDQLRREDFIIEGLQATIEIPVGERCLIRAHMDAGKVIAPAALANDPLTGLEIKSMKDELARIFGQSGLDPFPTYQGQATIILMGLRRQDPRARLLYVVKNRNSGHRKRIVLDSYPIPPMEIYRRVMDIEEAAAAHTPPDCGPYKSKLSYFCAFKHKHQDELPQGAVIRHDLAGKLRLYRELGQASESAEERKQREAQREEIRKEFEAIMQASGSNCIVAGDLKIRRGEDATEFDLDTFEAERPELFRRFQVARPVLDQDRLRKELPEVWERYQRITRRGSLTVSAAGIVE